MIPLPPWGGRFPRNPIMSLLDEHRRFNLAESTARDLTAGELIDLIGIEELRKIGLGYGSSAGLPPLREIVAEQSGVAPEAVVTTTGVALGLALLAFEACRPGDQVIVATPCFPPSLDVLAGSGLDVTTLQLRFDAGYRLDLARLEALVSDSTRLISLASPQNPSGTRLHADETSALLDIIDRRAPNALLFIDETYREATYGDEAARPSLAPLHPRLITGSSVSKAHGAPGLRVGWLTVPDPELRERLIVAKMNFVISGSPLSEALAAGLLARPDAVLRPRHELLSAGLAMTEAWLQNEPRLEWVRPEAGALCCIRFRPEVWDEVVAAFWDGLAAHELQLASGEWFGESRRVMRLGFGYLPLEGLRRALDAVTRALDLAERAAPEWLSCRG